ncbi:MAG: NAD(P)H-hydrate dehydratase, partial [Kordiimonadaceae bacterium]|nr:NAD(P)H-hydrate dehydratase [Kordiimonadaceae bacterium]
ALLGSITDLRGDARVMAKQLGGDVFPLKENVIKDYDVIVDAIFGTGLSKDVSGDAKKAIEKANEVKAYKIAIDIPSGIKGDTGEVLSAAFKADKTITFCCKKPAHILYPGKSFCGEVIVTDIGISERTLNEIKRYIYENHPDLWRDKLPKIDANGHKYHRGHAVVVSGDMIHTGGCRLAAKAALRIGAGLVSVSSPDDALAIHGAHLTAIMIRKLNELHSDLKNGRLNAWCIGPAAGTSDLTRNNVIDIILAGKKVVVDADGLSAFEDTPLELFDAIKSIGNNNCVLTPHSGEFTRLFPYLKILDKVSATRSAAKLSGAVVVYKGADTVIAAPDGRTVISNNAPATLSTAGSGDVLAGLVTGLQAQKMPSFEAACAAVWIHSECANAFGVGLISEDLEKITPKIMTELGTFCRQTESL